jgi:hypothetical protein
MKNLKQMIINKMKELSIMDNKEKICLNDLYLKMEEKPSSIRGTINLSIKKQENIFNRLGKGYYNLQCKKDGV